MKRRWAWLLVVGVSPFAARPVGGDEPETMNKVITNSIGVNLVLIPAGEFMMGSRESTEELAKVFEKEGLEPSYFEDEHPQHRVKITRPFYLGAHEVTVGQFRKFVSDTSYKTDAEKDGKGGYGFNESKGRWEQKPEYTWRHAGFRQDDDHPVVNVSWNDAMAFCGWRSRKERKTYRLPTEAEWEYACRAGTTTRYYFGDDPEGLARVGNVADGTAKERFDHWTTISSRDGYVFTAPVGKFAPNAFGLYDTHGNVWEWCQDWYDEDYYTGSLSEDPQGASSGGYRIVRGGCWLNHSGYCRSAPRSGDSPTSRNYGVGFRVARDP